MHCKNCKSIIEGDYLVCTSCNIDLSSNDNNKLHTASSYKRLANYFIDKLVGLVVLILPLIIFVVILTILVKFNLISKNNIFLKLVGIYIPVIIVIFIFVFNFIYYIIFEGIWGRTIGKWITKTKVVSLTGRKPKFKQIVIRSLSRLIPFEAFSFLIHTHPIGLHDSLSKTIVVPSSFTVEDVENLDISYLKKKKNNLLLIVVLVIVGVFYFIAVVGFASTFALSILTSAKSKIQNPNSSYEQESRNQPLNVITSTDGISEAIMKKIASDTNVGLPKMVDSGTRLDSVMGFENGLTYNFTLMNFTLRDLKGKSLNKEFRSEIVRSICLSGKMYIFNKNGSVFNYTYKDKNGIFVENIFIDTKIECMPL